MITFTILVVILILLIRLFVKLFKKSMKENNRTVWEELQHEFTHSNSSTTKSARKPSKNNGWRYKGNISQPITVALPSDSPLEIPEGYFKIKIFIYDARPLKGKRNGSKFRVAIVPGIHTMTSVYTGRQWTSNGAVAYNNQLIGFVADGYPLQTVTELMKEYPYITLQAERGITVSGGWPIVNATLPPKKWIESAKNHNVE